jgi:hypothetical protein
MNRHFRPGIPTPRRALKRVAKPRVIARTSAGRAITRAKALALAELATWPKGTGAIAGVLDGGTLSALVQLELADRIETDRIGGCRYIANEQGLQLLHQLGVLQEVRAS